MEKILQNAAYCHNCNTMVQSTSNHHYAMCECGKLALDGGREYPRVICDDFSILEDYSLNSNSSAEEIHEKLLWGTRGINGDLAVTFKPIRTLETSHLEAILKTQTTAAKYILEAVKRELRIRRINTTMDS